MGNLRLPRKTHIPYRKGSEQVIGFMLDILDFYGRRTQHAISLRIMQKPEPSQTGNLRFPRKTHIPYRRGSEHVSGKVLYARHPRFLRKKHTTCRKFSDNAKAGAELNGKS